MAKAVLIFLMAVALFGCSSWKSTKKEPHKMPTLDNSLIQAGQEDVKKRFGEPDTVSLTSDNHIMWVYRPSWKLMPDEKGTIYVEFQDGKVVKVFRIK